MALLPPEAKRPAGADTLGYLSEGGQSASGRRLRLASCSLPQEEDSDGGSSENEKAAADEGVEANGEDGGEEMDEASEEEDEASEEDDEDDAQDDEAEEEEEEALAEKELMMDEDQSEDEFVAEPRVG